MAYPAPCRTEKSLADLAPGLSAAATAAAEGALGATAVGPMGGMAAGALRMALTGALALGRTGIRTGIIAALVADRLDRDART